MSASLGAGEKKKEGVDSTKYLQEALKHLKLVCCNLDSPTVLFPQNEDLRNVRATCPDIADEQMIAVPERPNDVFKVVFIYFFVWLFVCLLVSFGLFVWSSRLVISVFIHLFA